MVNRRRARIGGQSVRLVYLVHINQTLRNTVCSHCVSLGVELYSGMKIDPEYRAWIYEACDAVGYLEYQTSEIYCPE